MWAMPITARSTAVRNNCSLSGTLVADGARSDRLTCCAGWGSVVTALRRALSSLRPEAAAWPADTSSCIPRSHSLDSPLTAWSESSPRWECPPLATVAPRGPTVCWRDAANVAVPYVEFSQSYLYATETLQRCYSTITPAMSGVEPANPPTAPWYCVLSRRSLSAMCRRGLWGEPCSWLAGAIRFHEANGPGSRQTQRVL